MQRKSQIKNDKGEIVECNIYGVTLKSRGA